MKQFIRGMMLNRSRMNASRSTAMKMNTTILKQPASPFSLFRIVAGFLPGQPFWGDALPAALEIVLGIAFGKVKPWPF